MKLISGGIALLAACHEGSRRVGIGSCAASARESRTSSPCWTSWSKWISCSTGAPERTGALITSSTLWWHPPTRAPSGVILGEIFVQVVIVLVVGSVVLTTRRRLLQLSVVVHAITTITLVVRRSHGEIGFTVVSVVPQGVMCTLRRSIFQVCLLWRWWWASCCRG